MKICNKCGAQNEDGTQFCTGCGAPLNGVPNPAGAPVPTKPPKKKMKAWQIILIILAVIVVLVVGISLFGGSDETDTAQPAGQAQSDSANVAQDETSDGGNLGDYDVQLKSSKIVNDYEGKKALMVTYTFTNYAEDPSNFSTALLATAYQNGVELSTAILYDVDGYDGESSLKNVQTGKSIDVQEAYVLDDETSEVEITVSDWLSLTDKSVTYNISLSDAQ